MKRLLLLIGLTSCSFAATFPNLTNRTTPLATDFLAGYRSTDGNPNTSDSRFQLSMLWDGYFKTQADALYSPLGHSHSLTFTGDVTGSGTSSVALTLAGTAVTPGTYGSATQVPVLTVDGKGRITSATTVPVYGLELDPYNYGVTGNGSTDDTTNFQACLNAVPSTGAKIKLRKGTYYIPSGGLTCANPVVIEGDGCASFTGVGLSNIVTDHATAVTLTLSSQGSTVRGVNFLHRSAVTGSGVSAPTAGCFLRLPDADVCMIEKCSFFGHWNGIEVVTGRYYWVKNNYFSDFVNWPAYIRNTGAGDFGDSTWTENNFVATLTSRVSPAAVRWESGGGLKFVGNKINGNQDQSNSNNYTLGLDLSVADAVSTSVFTITGNSIEGVVSHCIVFRQAGTTGNLSKLVVTGNEFLSNSGAGLFVTSSATSRINRVYFGGNYGGPGRMINVDYVDTFVLGSNSWEFPTTASRCIEIGPNCSRVLMEPQGIKPDSSNNAWLMRDDHYRSASHVDYFAQTKKFTRGLPSTTSNSTYVTLFRFQPPSLSGAMYKVTFAGQATGLGAMLVQHERAITRGSGGSVTVTSAGTDVAVGPGAAGIDVSYDVAAVSGEVQIKVRLASTATDLFGYVEVEICGPVYDVRVGS